MPCLPSTALPDNSVSRTSAELNRVLTTAALWIFGWCFWKCYVDDVSCSLSNQHVGSFLPHLNPSIQFTGEDEQHLPFLDIFHHDGSISTSVYRKPTHTNRYLVFTSHHPNIYKAELYSASIQSFPMTTIPLCTVPIYSHNARGYVV